MRGIAALLLVLVGACASGVSSTDAVEAPVVVVPVAEPEPEPVSEPQSAARAAAAGHAIDAITLLTIVTCWFESPYDPMFEAARPVTVGNGSFGMLMAGISGILYYGDLNTCAGRVSGTRPRSYSDNSPFEALSGLPVHSARMREGQPFGFYNPDIIAWGRRNLIPDPSASVAGVSLQLIYDRVFSRFFRMMTEAFLVLRNAGSYQQQLAAYRQMAGNPSQDGIDWLQGRYSQILPAYAAPADGTTMTPQMAIGFWLRRGIDGTSDELWLGLREVMHRFDGSWFGTLAARYTSQEIQW